VELVLLGLDHLGNDRASEADEQDADENEQMNEVRIVVEYLLFLAYGAQEFPYVRDLDQNSQIHRDV